ncbi:MAG: hypothetical protein QF464_17230, partial [Myxococcota bacterium]|nr:hypothetical protein [Myxococcota bacterium]
CTTEDTCTEGACAGGPALECDDDNACTVDTCEPEFGLCKHTSVHCGPDPESPCATADCDEASGCLLGEDLACTDETLIWHTTLACDQDSGWSWGVEMEHPGFTLTSNPPAAGPLGPGCHAQLVVTAEEVAVGNPWTSTMQSPEIELVTDNSAPVVVRFWHTWEWAGAGADEDVERRVNLIDGDEQVVESVPLDTDDSAWGAWVQSEVTLPYSETGTYRVAFSLTSKPTVDAVGYTWTIDHIVLYSGPPPQ